MNKVKVAIIIVLCFIIILCMTLFIMKANNHHNNYEVGQQGEVGNIDTSLKKQQSPNMYFAVEDYLNIFFEGISKKNSEQTYYLLHEDYINQNNIKNENILDTILKIPDFQDFAVKEMYVKEEENAYSNYVKGTIAYQDKKETWYGLVEVNNGCLAILPLEEKTYQNVINGIQEIERKSIKPNEYNMYFATNYFGEKLYRKYFEDYIKKALYDIDEAYELLDSEYRKVRFNDEKELFENYITDKKEQLEQASMVSYSISYNGYDIESIVIKDNFGNYYIIKENAILDYTIQLDNYTIKTEEFKEKYSKLSETNKVVTNLDEFVSMINNKDFEHAYNKLYQEFKNNYFSTKEKFKKYMTMNYYDYNILSVMSITQSETNGVYICETTLKNGTGGNVETKEFSIIMDLLDENDYILSFTVLDN